MENLLTPSDDTLGDIFRTYSIKRIKNSINSDTTVNEILWDFPR